MRISPVIAAAALLACTLAACGGGGTSGPASPVPPSGPVPAAATPAEACADRTTPDDLLRCMAQAAKVTPLEAPPVVGDALYNAGNVLFNSTLLSGTGSVSCASCHRTNNAGIVADEALHASLRNSPNPIHRNTPDLVNKLLGGRKFLMWDGRIGVRDDGSFFSPAGDKLPAGLDSMLAVQALFPLLSRDEMLGYAPGSGDGAGENAIAALVGDPVEANPQPVWDAIMTRIKGNATLLNALKNAYPAVPEAQLGIQHVGNALAAFQTRRWNASSSSANFHGYLKGTRDLTDSARRGGILFFDKAGCYRCHNGPLFSDQKFYNLAVPQVGSGFGSGVGSTPRQDRGRFEITGNDADRYAFITPSLWEVRVTGPYMHNGVYATLERAVRHHLDATAAAQAFRCTDAPLLGAVPVPCSDSTGAPALYADLLARLATELQTTVTLTDAEVADLLAFLNQLNNGAN